MSLNRTKTGLDHAQIPTAKDPKQSGLDRIAQDLGLDTADKILWSLANVNPNEFGETHYKSLKAVMQEAPDKVTDLLRYRSKSGVVTQNPDYKGTSVIHQAIKKKNYNFLYHLLSQHSWMGQTQEPSDLADEIVSGLKDKDPEDQLTCLHASIQQKLPCVIDIVNICAAAEAEAEASQRRKMRGQTKFDANADTDADGDADADGDTDADGYSDEDGYVDEKSDSIFLMCDHAGNTPLHLLVDTLGKGMKAPGHGTTTSGRTLEFDVLSTIDAIELKCGSKMSKLWSVVNEKGFSPYSYLLEALERSERSQNRTGDDLQSKRQFRDKIRAKVFSSFDDIRLLKRALYGTREKELSLDMSDFSQSSHDFKTFVSELTASSPNTLLFEEELVSVFLPDLNSHKKKIPHEGVNELFGWLKDSAKVKKIKSLNIPDNTSTPMSDEFVLESILERFEIEKFVWRKLDINLDILVSSPHSNAFTDITLYSTGNYSVLYHWVSADGIGSLPNLRNVNIEIMPLNSQNESATAVAKHKQVVNRYRGQILEILKLRQREKEKLGCRFTYDVNATGKWDFPVPQLTSQRIETGQLELIKKLQASHEFLLGMASNTDDTKKKMKQYSDRFKKIRARESGGSDDDSKLKVAIIDNGADKFQQEIHQAIERGVSFVTADTYSADRILPWWMVSDPHGTQMASLVVAANPWCRLYIARVGKGRRDILPDDAVQAVKWAMEQEVDIISISWVTKTMVPDLRDAIEDAAKSALVFCSTADRGNWSGPAYPASYDGTVSVSATDKYGNLRPASSDKGHEVNIPVPGEDIPVFGPSYMGENIMGVVSGSSVATALAAGIASLSLLMLIVFNGSKKDMLRNRGFYNNKKMAKLLSMALGPSETGHELFPENTVDLPARWNLKNLVKLINKEGNP